jgi:hypothetical protein
MVENSKISGNGGDIFFLLRSLNLSGLILISLFLLLIVFPYIFLFLFVKKLPQSPNEKKAKKRGIEKIFGKIEELIITVIMESTRIDEKINEKIKIPPKDKESNGGKEQSVSTQKQASTSEKFVNFVNFEKRLDLLESRFKEFENKPTPPPDANKTEITESNFPTSETQNVKYLRGMSKDGDGFNLINDVYSDDCFFKIFNINNDTADFELCVEVKRAKENNIFEYTNICRESTTGKNKTGKLKRNGDKWDVTEPTELKI